MAGNMVGIDLGTTFSAVAHLDDHGHPVTIPNRDNDLLTPSAVLLLDDGSAVVGQAALDVALEQPERVATLAKRKMGESSYGRLVAGREFRPETLSAIILRKLVQDAERRIGPITKAVVTVPAYFDEPRRKATKDAGRIAGLEVMDILDEPTAAALAYSFQPPRPLHGDASSELLPQEQRTVMVYDLGGGTFDVTVVRLSRQRFETLAIEGDAMLGGKDWDQKIVEHVAKQFLAKHGIDPRNDAVSLTNLQAAAERAKKTLSKLPTSSVTCTHGGKVLTVPLSRAEFEKLTSDQLFRTRFLAGEAVKAAGLAWNKIDRVLLVGGSTHMPMTSRMLRELSGKEPDNSLAVSEVVARGAAIHAGIVAAKSAEALATLDPEALAMLADVVEINVNAHSLGIEARDSSGQKVNDILVPKNTQLPVANSRVYYTKGEGQQKVRVNVLQGEAPEAQSCIPIGECWVDGLPPNMPKGSPIQVRCGVASNGLVDVLALDMTSGKMARTVIRRASGLTEEEIARETEIVRSLRIE